MGFDDVPSDELLLHRFREREARQAAAHAMPPTPHQLYGYREVLRWSPVTVQHAEWHQVPLPEVFVRPDREAMVRTEVDLARDIEASPNPLRSLIEALTRLDADLDASALTPLGLTLSTRHLAPSHMSDLGTGAVVSISITCVSTSDVARVLGEDRAEGMETGRG